MSKILFLTREDKSHICKPPCNVLFIIYSQAKNCINTKSHVIDIFTSEDMVNMSLCISQYLTLYYIIKNNNHAKVVYINIKLYTFNDIE